MKSKLMKARSKLRKAQGTLKQIKQATSLCEAEVNKPELDGNNGTVSGAYRSLYTTVKDLVGKPRIQWDKIKMGRKIIHPEHGEAQLVVSQGDNKISVVQKGSSQILNWAASECKLKK